MPALTATKGSSRIRTDARVENQISEITSEHHISQYDDTNLTLRLLFSQGEVKNSLFSLKRNKEYLIGRAGADFKYEQDDFISLQDAMVSRRHAQLSIGAEGSVRLVDTESKNGTYINGVALHRGETINVGDGDIIRVGSALLMVRRSKQIVKDLIEMGPLRGFSPALFDLEKQLKTLSQVAVGGNVLLLGKLGAGKKRLAEEFYRLSRLPGQFVHVHCHSVAEGVDDARQFFFGKRDEAGIHDGVFQQARNGVLFLERVEYLSSPVQRVLLRALESPRSVSPANAKQDEGMGNVTVIASCEEPINHSADGPTLREDVRSFLSEYIMFVPSLAQRREDILPSLCAFLGEHCELNLEYQQIETLLLYNWPYNLRELSRVTKSIESRAPISLFEHHAPPPLEEQQASTPSERSLLSNWRHQNGMSQQDLAARLGVSQRAVSLWENGARISAENRNKLQQLGWRLESR